MRNERGVTLIELILAIVLIGIIGSVAANAFLSSTQSALTANNVREAMQVDRTAMERMVREIRNVADNTSVLTANATQFEFVDVDGNTVSFELAGTTLNRVFTAPPAAAVTNTLATNVTGLTFTYLTNTGAGAAPIVAPAATDIWWVVIDLTVGTGGAAVPLRSRVHPRMGI
jgi:prepilin-type N-terminal cleavage/methylation domain-containing protein